MRRHLSLEYRGGNECSLVSYTTFLLDLGKRLKTFLCFALGISYKNIELFCPWVFVYVF